jgi:hypothetical protein
LAHAWTTECTKTLASPKVMAFLPLERLVAEAREAHEVAKIDHRTEVASSSPLQWCHSGVKSPKHAPHGVLQSLAYGLTIRDTGG